MLLHIRVNLVWLGHLWYMVIIMLNFWLNRLRQHNLTLLITDKKLGRSFARYEPQLRTDAILYFTNCSERKKGFLSIFQRPFWIKMHQRFSYNTMYKIIT